MPKIQKDKHGLYVQAGGYARPYEDDGGLAQDMIVREHNGRKFPVNGKTQYKEGDKVVVYHYPGTTLVRVGDECWFSHGIGANDSWGPSENAWRPMKSKAKLIHAMPSIINSIKTGINNG